jgi:hypothetical protein
MQWGAMIPPFENGGSGKVGSSRPQKNTAANKKKAKPQRSAQADRIINPKPAPLRMPCLPLCGFRGGGEKKVERHVPKPPFPGFHASLLAEFNAK